MMYLAVIKEYGKGNNNRLYSTACSDIDFIKQIIEDSLSKYEALISIDRISDPLHIDILPNDNRIEIITELIERSCKALFISKDNYLSNSKKRKLCSLII